MSTELLFLLFFSFLFFFFVLPVFCAALRLTEHLKAERILFAAFFFLSELDYEQSVFVPEMLRKDVGLRYAEP